jgi:hypothetical protein
MSIRANVTNGSWQNIGTGPAVVQLIAGEATGVEVMLVCQAGAPTGSDGIVLTPNFPSQAFTKAANIWAQVVQANLTAVVAVQPS